MVPLEGINILSFPFKKLSMDVLGPHGETFRGNDYIVSFVDLLTNWLEAFTILDKKAKTVAKLVINKTFPRYSAPVQ